MERKKFTVDEKLSWFKLVERGATIKEVADINNISQKTFYKWKNRYLQEGIKGLVNRPSTPKRKGRKIPIEVRVLIFELRDKTGFGPRKLAKLLQDEHMIRVSPAFISKTLRRPKPITTKVKIRDEVIDPEEIRAKGEANLDIMGILRVPL